jgi:hypothetical protein
LLIRRDALSDTDTADRMALRVCGLSRVMNLFGIKPLPAASRITRG